MRTAAVLTIFSTAVAAHSASQYAPPVTGNPAGVMYEATLPDKPFYSNAAISGNVKGSISAVAPANGTGVKFTIKFDNLPAEGGPFPYHIHVEPAPEGNCNQTLGHLDPYHRGQKPPCDATVPAFCEVGDLSGKHGKALSGSFNVEYIDTFLSLEEGNTAFFGNRSFVIHYANGTRLTCANFVKLEAPVPSTNPGQPPATSSPTQTAVLSSGGSGTNNFMLPLMVVPMTAILYALSALANVI